MLNSVYSSELNQPKFEIVATSREARSKEPLILL